MPKETFFNLPEDKRALIESAATKEFGQYGYDMASINRIVEQCKIAKGSFYQYFDDKKDLFFHLLDVMTERKLAYLAPVLKNFPNYDFFESVRGLFSAGIVFAAANPDGAKMAEWLMNNSKHEVFGEMMKMAEPKSDNFFQPMLLKAQEKGEIRKDLDINLISHIITTINTAALEYYYRTEESPAMIDKERMVDYLDKVVDILKFGLKNQGGQEND